jgi:carboxypeptidase Taq
MIARAEPATEAEATQLRLIAREHVRTVRIPADLATELARVTSVAQGIWAQARADDHIDAFLPTLAHVVRLKRVEAEALANGGDLYDALIDDYEPGMKAAELAALFDRMRPRLVDLRARIRDAGPAEASVAGHFPTRCSLRCRARSRSPSAMT